MSQNKKEEVKHHQPLNVTGSFSSYLVLLDGVALPDTAHCWCVTLNWVWRWLLRTVRLQTKGKKTQKVSCFKDWSIGGHNKELPMERWENHDNLQRGWRHSYWHQRSRESSGRIKGLPTLETTNSNNTRNSLNQSWIWNLLFTLKFGKKKNAERYLSTLCKNY